MTKDLEWIEAQLKLAGLTEKEVESFRDSAKSLSKMAADISAATNISIEEAVDQIITILKALREGRNGH
jgi:hypothetical protein